MCLLIFAHRADPRYPLVLAANRDEFHSRPTEASGFWAGHPGLLAGRDIQQGGTWMGITRDGRFAAITNYRDPSHTAPAPRSRGELPLAFLTGNRQPQEYLTGLLPFAQEYAGFNLLVGSAGELWYLTNSQPGGAHDPMCLEPGIYGLSNAWLDTPWPKVAIGKARLGTLLSEGHWNHASLAGVVGDRLLAAPGDLSRQGLNSGMDQILSAQFITTPTYGTRSTTTLWLDHRGLTHWRESSFDARGNPVDQREESFCLERS